MVDFRILTALHIIFIVTWFAALFYMPRLMIYQTEAKEKGKSEDVIEQLKIMQKRLWNIIGRPSMFLTLLFGPWLWYAKYDFLIPDWFAIKLFFVVLLFAYHGITQSLHKKLLKDSYKWSSQRLRYWNEIATVVLIAVVFLVEMKNTISWIYGVLGILGVAILLMIATKLYKKKRGEK